MSAITTDQVAAMDDERVLTRARQIVSYSPTDFGYSDVGETLVDYLRGDMDAQEALALMEAYHEDYERLRGRRVLRSNDG